MVTLKVDIDKETLKQAKAEAGEKGKSLDALVSEYLRAVAEERRARDATATILKIARRSRHKSGDKGRGWTRDELHER